MLSSERLGRIGLIINEFVTNVPEPFKHLAQVQAPYRILAPSKDTAFQPGGANQNYFRTYASSLGVNASTGDIFACAGTLASNAALCGALNRHVAQLPRGNGETRPSSTGTPRPTTTHGSGTTTRSG